MRISKSMAEDVAEKLLKPKYQKWQDQIDQMEKACNITALKYMDPEVMRVFKLHGSYFRTTKSICFHSYINETRVELDCSIFTSIPSNSKYGRDYIEIMPKEFAKLQEMEDVCDKLRKEYKSSLDIVTNTIYNLRTPIQVKKHFPEAFELLPKSTNGTMLPMVNLDQVRALVQINTTSNAV